MEYLVVTSGGLDLSLELILVVIINKMPLILPKWLSGMILVQKTI